MTVRRSVATVQMDAVAAPTAARLERARELVSRSARDGAELVILPELFNVGYTYDASNYARAEPPSGETASFLRRTARELAVHVAGSMLLYEAGEIYNSLLLCAPDGQTWRYDKTYPWGWERSAFRPTARGPVVANTRLGKLGMLICWDTAHRNLWRAYAGRVQFMLIASCPPDVSRPKYVLEDGRVLGLADFGGPMAALEGTGALLFGRMIDEQTRWLGMPCGNTVGCGTIRTPIPRARALLRTLSLLAPNRVPRSDANLRVDLEASFVEGCKVVDADGLRVAERTQQAGEGYALGEVALPDPHAAEKRSQPPTRLPRLAYLLSDFMLPRLMRPVYEKGVRKTWGVSPRSDAWLADLSRAVAGAGF